MTFNTKTRRSSLARLFCLLPSLLLTLNASPVQAETSGSTIVAPNAPQGRVSSEYFSSNPTQRLLVPVNIWGAVREPGIHYVPLNSTLTEVISSAGGPALDASVSDIKLQRLGQQDASLNLYKQGQTERVQAHDTIQVDQTRWQVNLPIIFGGIGVGISVITLFAVILK